MEEVWVQWFGELFDDDFEEWHKDEDEGEDEHANDRRRHRGSDGMN
jgi:hypothetical protein